MGDGVTNTRPPGRLSPDGSCLIAHRTSRKVPTGCTTYDDNPPQFKLTSTSRVNSLANLIIPNAVLLHSRRDCAARGSRFNDEEEAPVDYKTKIVLKKDNFIF